MMYYTYLLIALAIAGQVRAAEEPNSTPEPYAYGYEAPDHSAAEQRRPDGVVEGYYTLKGDDGRTRRVNYMADASGFHATIDTNEHGTQTSNPADAVIKAAPVTPEQLVYTQYQAPPQPQVQVVQQTVQPQKLQQQVQYTYQPGYTYGTTGYGYGQQVAYQPTTTTTNNAYGYTYVPGSTTNGYYQTVPQTGYYGVQGYTQPGYGVATTTTTGTAGSSAYGVGTGSVYGGYNYHTPGSYYSAVRSSSVQPVSGVNQVVSSSYPSTSSVYRTVSSSSTPIVGSNNYSILQKRDVEAAKPAAAAAQQEKANPEKPGQEKKTV